jgi:hypothetical protein
MFFLGGRGGKRKRQVMVNRVGRWTTRAFKQPHFVIYYMLSSGGFATACLQAIAKGVLDPRYPGQCTYVVQSSTTRRTVPHMRTVNAVYVVICYMSVICLVLGGVVRVRLYDI